MALSLPRAAVADVRGALSEARYTTDAVRQLLGPVASRALDRNETTPGIRALGADGSALAALTLLWPLQASVAESLVREALGPAYEALVAAEVLAAADGRVRALVDVRPYASEDDDWWVVCDLPPNVDGRQPPNRPDHVLGPSPASSTLAQLTVREPAPTALDLGTGCGVQALHLARHCERVIATDVNPRALALARVTADLNGIDVDLRRGDLYAPVAGEEFDLVVSNPPFVVGPGSGLTYRDSGLPGDELSRRVVVEGARVLAPGGLLQVLATWLHRPAEDWHERVTSWVAGTGCDAWVLQREVQDPAEHAEVWLRDSGDVSLPTYRQAYADWLDWFAASGADGVGFGWVVLRRTDSATSDVRIEEWPYEVAQPLGPEVGRHLATIDTLRRLPEDDALLAARFRLAGDVTQEEVRLPGAEDPTQVVLRRSTGLRRARAVGTAEAGLVGACDGTIPLGTLLDAVAQVLDEDPAELRTDLLPRVRELVVEGFLDPA